MVCLANFRRQLWWDHREEYARIPRPPLLHAMPCREELAAGKERELQKREAALASAEQRVAALTRRLEADLQLNASSASPKPFVGPAASASAGTAVRSQLGGSLEGMRGSYEGAVLNPASTSRLGLPAGSTSKQALPSRLANQQQQAAASALPHASQQQQQQRPEQSEQQAPSSSSLAASFTGGTFATPASSLLRSGSLDTMPPASQQQQQATGSAVSTAAGGGAAGALRRDSFASLDGTPDRQASLAAALKQVQASTDKGAHRWAGCS